VPPNRLLCGQCGEFRTHIVTGDEMTLQSVELDKA
jgi:Zn finger protein HypA/HybF involved in hydrogenase expression